VIPEWVLVIGALGLCALIMFKVVKGIFE